MADELYFYQPCSPTLAEVELYRILDAPPVLPKTFREQQMGIRPNPRACVLHAHRRDNPGLDYPPGLGCSSKLGHGPLMAHNRGGLTDDRGHSAGEPVVTFGSIYQYWTRSAEHPSKPGKERSQVPAKGHAPDHPIFEKGYGAYPAGHPGNDMELPGASDDDPRSGQVSASVAIPEAKTEWSSINAAELSTDTGANSIPSASERDEGKTPARSRVSATVATLLSSSTPLSPVSPPSLLRSSTTYRQLPHMNPYDPIPPTDPAAADSAEQLYSSIKNVYPGILVDFEAKWQAWQKTWFPADKPSPPRYAFRR